MQLIGLGHQIGCILDLTAMASLEETLEMADLVASLIGWYSELFSAPARPQDTLSSNQLLEGFTAS